MGAMHVTAVDPHQQRPLRPGHVGTGPLRAGRVFLLVRASLGERRLLRAQLALQAAGDGVDVAAGLGRVQRAAQRQDLGEEFDGQPVGHDSCEAGFEVHQLGGAPLGQRSGDRTERRRWLRPARAVIPAGAGETQRGEQGSHHDRRGVVMAAWFPAVLARHLCGQLGADMLVGDRGLDPGEQVVGLGQPLSAGLAVCVNLSLLTTAPKFSMRSSANRRSIGDMTADCPRWRLGLGRPVLGS